MPAESKKRTRLYAALGTWALLFLSVPGLGRAGGFGHIAFVALVPWALHCSRPGRKAFLVEWIAASIGLAAIFGWLCHVLPGVALPSGMLLAVHPAAGGVLLRRLARRFPLAVATPVAWTASEMLRWLVPMPFSVGWFRLGTMAHDTEWLSGSARVWGVWGLGYVFAAFGGWLADLWRIQHGVQPAAHGGRKCAVLGITPLVLAFTLSVATSAPPVEDGPRVMLVQPAFPQERKAFSEDPFRETYGVACALTAQGLAEARERGEASPDLVCWGETMLFVPLTEPGLAGAVRSGVQPLPWTEWELDSNYIQTLRVYEETFVKAVFFGRKELLHGGLRPRFAELAREGEEWAVAALAGEALLPADTSFFSGAEYFLVRDEAVRRMNATVLWNAEGERGAPGGKLMLVPGAEALYFLEGWSAARNVVKKLGGYVPDLVPALEVGLHELETRSGKRYRFASSVCFDNAFDAPYTRPLRTGDVDFHLVASNEAWYEDGVEMDWMVAFSRLIAVETGRSVVRVGNAGVSIVIDPDGRDVARLEVDGHYKLVRGTLRATVPVPVRGASGEAPQTLFVGTERLQKGLWWLGFAILALMAGRETVTSGVESSTRSRSDSPDSPESA